MPARLIVEAGLATPPLLDLQEHETYTLGRKTSASLHLHDIHASRDHGAISFDQGVWLWHYAPTTNGTLINDSVVDADVVLEDKQVIIIGDVKLRFSVITPGVTTPVVVHQTGDLEEATQFAPDELSALLHFTKSVYSQTTPRSVIALALQTLIHQTGAEVAGYMSLDPEEPESRLVLPEQARVDLRLSQQLTRAVRKRQGRVWLSSGDCPEIDSESLVGYSDALCIPVGGEDYPGALHLYLRRREFSPRLVRFCEAIASSLTMAMDALRSRLALQAANERYRERASISSDILVGSSSVMVRLREQVGRLAEAPCNILVVGESGVGKELVAQGLHRLSPRHNGPLVTVNCAAISAGLAESELFGHVKGSFSGAFTDHAGYFAQADTGTLFLDELGELSADIQAKLLRVLETRLIRPVGGRRETRVDVRIVAATNRDLEREVREGRFRRDLYYRMTTRLAVPPLREHAEDVPELARHFLDHLEQEYRRKVQLSPGAMERLRAENWPGNVRQLRSVLETAVANLGLARGVIHAGDLSLGEDGMMLENGPPGLNLEAVEQWAIRQAIGRTNGNKSRAAEMLGIHRETLGLKMKEYGIEAKEKS